MPEISGDFIRQNTTGVILAGGKGRRMGGKNKGLLEIKGRRMIEYVLAAIRKQLTHLMINANDDLGLYQSYGCQVVRDELEGFQGPLAGMSAALKRCRTRWLCTVPCDSPLLAEDLLARLHRALADQSGDLAVAHDGERLHPVFCLMRSDLHDHIRRVIDQGERKIEKIFVGIKVSEADFSDKPECFLNVNRPEDLSAMENLLQK